MTLGHVLLVVGSLYMGWWQLPVLVTLGSFYGGFLFLLCNNTQHIGLSDNVADFRLCTRTILLNPIVRFLYWHMNFHIEHHMYAAVVSFRNLLALVLLFCRSAHDNWSPVESVLQSFPG